MPHRFPANEPAGKGAHLIGTGKGLEGGWGGCPHFPYDPLLDDY